MSICIAREVCLNDELQKHMVPGIRIDDRYKSKTMQFMKETSIMGIGNRLRRDLTSPQNSRSSRFYYVTTSFEHHSIVVQTYVEGAS